MPASDPQGLAQVNLIFLSKREVKMAQVRTLSHQKKWGTEWSVNSVAKRPLGALWGGGRGNIVEGGSR